MFKVGDIVLTSFHNFGNYFGSITEIKHVLNSKKRYYVVKMFSNDHYYSFYEDNLKKVNRPLTIPAR